MSAGQDQDTVDEKKLFVGGLSWETREPSLKEYFSQFGEVFKVEIKYDKETQRPRGFGFVTFKDAAPMERVLAQETHQLDGKFIDPKPATSKTASSGATGTPPTGYSAGGQENTKKVFIGGIPPLGPGIETRDILEAAIKELLEDKTGAGTVAQLEIKQDPKLLRHKGFGFALFTTQEAAEAVCQGHYYTLHGKTMEIKKADARYKNRGGGYGNSGYGYSVEQRQWGGYPGGSYPGYGSDGSEYAQQGYGMYQGYSQPQSYPQTQQTGHHGNSVAQMGTYDQYYGSSAQGDSTAGSYNQGYGSYGGSYGGHQGSHPGYAGQPQQQQPQQQYYGHHPGR